MLVSGNSHTDERGRLNFVNDFNFPDVKRFYTITHADTNTIRAWQGHKIETKHFFVTKGSFIIGWVKPDDWEDPSNNLTVTKQVLTQDEPAILTIEAGYANGFRALEANSTLLVFSNLNLEESGKDIYRFDSTKWTL